MKRRLPPSTLALASILAACGARQSGGSTIGSAPADALSLVPEAADLLVRMDVATIRANPATAPVLARLVRSLPDAELFAGRAREWWFAGDFDIAEGDDAYVVFFRFEPDALDAVREMLANDPPSDGMWSVLMGDTLVVSEGDFGRSVERRHRRGDGRLSPIVDAFRSRQAASPSTLIDGVFVPSSEMREQFATGADEREARAMLRRLAEGVPRIDFALSSVEGRIVGGIDFPTADDEVAGILETVLVAAASAAPEDDDVTSRLLERYFSRVDLRREGHVVRTRGDLGTIEELVALSTDELDAGLPEEASSSALPSHPALDLADRGDSRGVIAMVGPQVDDLLGRVGDDPRALLALTLYVDALEATDTPSAVIAMLDRLEASLAASGATVPTFPFGMRITVARVAALRDRYDLAAALGVVDRAVARTADPFASSMLQEERGFLLAMLGRFEDASDAMRLALEADADTPISVDEARAAGPDTLARYLSHRNSLAWMHFLAGRPALGLPIADEVLALVPESPNTRPRSRAAYINTRANLLASLGRHAEAAAAHRDELEAVSEALGPDAPRRVLTLLGLTRVEEALGHHDKSLRYARQAVAIVDRTRPVAHPETALAHLRLAEAMAANGDARGAAAEASRAVALFGEGVLPSHPDRVAAEAFAAASAVRR